MTITYILFTQWLPCAKIGNKTEKIYTLFFLLVASCMPDVSPAVQKQDQLCLPRSRQAWNWRANKMQVLRSNGSDVTVSVFNPHAEVHG